MVAGMRYLSIAIAVVSLLCVGCTVPSPGPPSEATSAPAGPASSAPASSAPAASPGTVESESAREAGIDLTTLPAPIVSGRIPAQVSDDPDATMEIALYSLRRTGKVVTATFSFRVHSAGDRTGTGMLFGYLGGEIWRPYLVDTINLRRHGVLTGDGVGAQTSSNLRGQRFRPGQTLYAYAMFAAPPTDVTMVDVQLVSGLPTAVGVPIT